MYPIFRFIEKFGLAFCFSFVSAAFIELVHSSNGTTQRGKDYGGLQDNKPKRLKSSSREGKRNLLVVPSHFVHTDISGIKEDTLIFSNMMFCILLEFFLLSLLHISLSKKKFLFSLTVFCIRFLYIYLYTASYSFDFGVRT